MSTLLTTPNGEIIIRNATPVDAAAVRLLRLESLSTYPESFAADMDMTAAQDAQVWSQRIAEYIQTSSSAILLAFAGDSLIGMAGIGRGHWPKLHHFATLWGVYVKPEWQGLHIGEAIVIGCVNWALENQMKVVTLGVNVSNKFAIRCYSRCGFKEYGTQPRVIFYNGIYHDQLLMAVLL